MASFKPDGWPSVAVRIFAADPQGLVEFLRAVFAAAGDYHAGRPAEMWVGDSVIMVSGDDQRDAMSACLYVYVEDTDATYQRALEAGAHTMEPPGDMPYGDRRATIRDRWGNVWQVATRTEVPVR